MSETIPNDDAKDEALPEKEALEKIKNEKQKQAYIELIEINGFKNITIQKEKPITVPDDILSAYLSSEEIKQFKSSGTGIFSVTVFAQKSKEACCEPGCCSN